MDPHSTPSHPMSHDHNHTHQHGGFHSHFSSETSPRRLLWALFINLLLTIAQVAGGLISGSMSLLADALHNLSDAGALGIAALAAYIAHLPANSRMTYGYRRAEILGALINSTSLLLVGVFLIYETCVRFYNPQPIQGGLIIGVASVALVIDLATAWMTYKGSQSNLNFRAAFIHNLSDAMASVVVIISGSLILLFQIYWIDLVASLLISFYVLYHSQSILKECVRILMQSSPSHIHRENLVTEISAIAQVREVHHIHVWQLDDQRIHFEGHIVIHQDHLGAIEEIKANIRTLLRDKFHIQHSTLEVEISSHCENP
ncbi:MAG: cation transporter [Bdellovibrionales bacterium]|nr:cation transporter [Bdellovibrionales bacterium]